MATAPRPTPPPALVPLPMADDDARQVTLDILARVLGGVPARELAVRLWDGTPLVD